MTTNVRIPAVIGHVDGKPVHISPELLQLLEAQWNGNGTGSINAVLSGIATAQSAAAAAATAAAAAQDDADTLGTRADTVTNNRNGGLLANWNFQEIDTAGRPAGINKTTTASPMDQVTSSATGIKFAGSPDNDTQYGFPAIPIDDSLTYKVVIRHKSSASSTNGLFLRFEELASALPQGSTHVGSTTVSPHCEARDSVKSLVSNGAMPGTTLTEDEYTYTPTSGTLWATFAMYNWTAFTGDYEVESVTITPIVASNVLQSASVSPDTDSYIGSASSGSLGDFVITPNGGDGTYTYATTMLTGDSSVWTITDGTTNSVQIDWSASPTGSPNYQATFKTVVTETSSGRKVEVIYSAWITLIEPP